MIARSVGSMDALTASEIQRSATAEYQGTYKGLKFQDVFGTGSAILSQKLRLEHPVLWRTLNYRYRVSLGLEKEPVATPVDPTDCP
jgi:hypothetical protein